MNCSVFARSVCTNFSPGFGTRPFGRKIAVLECPAAIFVLVRGDRGGQQRVDREPLGGETDGRGGDIGEAHRAMPAQRGDPGVGRGGDHGAQHAVGDFAAMLAHEQIGGQRLRPPAEAGDALDRSVREPDHDRRHAGDIDQVRLQHAQAHAGGHTGVDRVAARLQDGEARRRGQIMAGRNGMAGAVNTRTMGHYATSRLCLALA